MKYIFTSYKTYPLLKEKLSHEGHVIEIPINEGLYAGISDHADLHVHPIGNTLFISKELCEAISPHLTSHGLTFKTIEKTLGNKYPLTAALNIVSNPYHLIHNLEISSPELILFARKMNISLIHVNQGYTRCSLLPLSTHHYITPDHGIFQGLNKRDGLDVVLIDNGPVVLDGHKHGFFPGTCGVVGDTLYVNGDLTTHPNHLKITSICHTLKLNISDVPDRPLKDIGSILYYERFL